MSQKSQVKKVLPFTVLPKWQIGSSLTRSSIFKECLRVVLECLKTSGSVCWCLFVSLDVWRGVSIDLGDIFGMPKRQEFVHLTLLRYQNIKTSLSTISKNVCVLPFFLIFMSVRGKLQFTVSFDHPVSPCIT